MIKYILPFLACFAIFVSCKEKPVYFYGEIITIDSNVKPDTLYSEKIELEGLYTGSIWAYDTLIGFTSSKFPNYFMNVFSLRTGKFLYSLCKRGIGPDEFPALAYSSQYEYEDHLYLWLRTDAAKDESWLVNLEKPGTVIKKRIDVKVETGFQYNFGFVFILNDSMFIGNNQGESLYQGDGSFLPQTYHLYNAGTRQRIKSYKLYNGSIPVSDIRHCYCSWDRIKPDKTKLAMGMQLIDQINILDLKTGQIKGYRNKTSPEFGYLSLDPENFKAYYSFLLVDDRYIYGLCANEKVSPIGVQQNNIINVFDWDGNFIKKIFLDRTVFGTSITLDVANKYLYMIDPTGEDEEEIYRYDVSYLYK
jgi:hypothetical protein